MINVNELSKQICYLNRDIETRQSYDTQNMCDTLRVKMRGNSLCDIDGFGSFLNVDSSLTQIEDDIIHQISDLLCDIKSNNTQSEITIEYNPEKGWNFDDFKPDEEMTELRKAEKEALKKHNNVNDYGVLF